MATSPRSPRPPAPGARRIENAARRLFANRGYAATSMADIAVAAGVSKATVFHHYRSKRRLYESLVGDAFAGFREQLIPLLDVGRDAEGSLRDFAAAHLERLTRMQGTMRLIAREMLGGTAGTGEEPVSGEMSRNFSLLVEALRRGQATGTIRSDADPGLAAFLLLSSSWFVFQTSALVKRNPDLKVATDTAAYAAELARLLYYGLAPRTGPDPRESS